MIGVNTATVVPGCDCPKCKLRKAINTAKDSLAAAIRMSEEARPLCDWTYKVHHLNTAIIEMENALLRLELLDKPEHVLNK